MKGTKTSSSAMLPCGDDFGAWGREYREPASKQDCVAGTRYCDGHTQESFWKRRVRFPGKRCMVVDAGPEAGLLGEVALARGADAGSADVSMVGGDVDPMVPVQGDG